MPDLVTKSDIKAYAGVEHSDDDSRIGDIASHLSDWLKASLERHFFTTTVTERLDGNGKYLIATTYPIQSITHIKDMRPDNPDTIDSDNYTVIRKGMVMYDSGGTQWGDGQFRYEAKYEGGYGTTQDDLPNDLVEDLSVLGTILYNEPDVTIQSMRQGDESAKRAGVVEERDRILKKWKTRGHI